MQRLTRLVHLDLSENEIETIPRRAFAGPNLDIVLMFQHKTLSSGLEALDFLALNHNKLTALAASHFDGLPSLSSLELDYNRIAKIDKAAFNGLESERENMRETI